MCLSKPTAKWIFQSKSLVSKQNQCRNTCAYRSQQQSEYFSQKVWSASKTSAEIHVLIEVNSKVNISVLCVFSQIDWTYEKARHWDRLTRLKCSFSLPSTENTTVGVYWHGHAWVRDREHHSCLTAWIPFLARTKQIITVLIAWSKVKWRRGNGWCFTLSDQQLSVLKTIFSKDRANHHSTDRLKQSGVEKGKWLMFHTQRSGTNCIILTVGTVSVHMGVSQRYDAVLQWNWS